jgi:hypothetical protein
MATCAGVAAETDCCGNLYPLHVPVVSREPGARDASLAATTIALAARVMWTIGLVCAWSGLL